MTPQTLKIQGAGMPPFMLDECTQTLEVVPLGGLHRTVNGELIYTGIPSQKKYQSVCAGKGKVAPGLGALHRGDEVKIWCLQRLWQEGVTPWVTLARTAVPESILVMDEERQPVAFTVVGEKIVTLNERPRTPCYLSYCPVLTMRVVDIKLMTEEWGESPEWRLVLEEV